jgi:hypothetical protein
MSLNSQGIYNAAQAGILHPKVANKFVVKFSATFDGVGDLSQERAVELLNALTAQLVSAQIPSRHPGTVPLINIVPRAQNFIGINTDGKASFVFEDDISNILQEGLNFIMRPDVSVLNALIMVVDGDERVLEAYLVWDMTVRTVEHGGLDYANNSGVTKTLTTSSRQIQHAFWRTGTTPTLQELVEQTF